MAVPIAPNSFYGIFCTGWHDIFQLVGCEGAEGATVVFFCVHGSIKALEATRLAPMLEIIRKKFFRKSNCSGALALGPKYTYSEHTRPTPINIAPEVNTVFAVLFFEIRQIASINTTAQITIKKISIAFSLC